MSVKEGFLQRHRCAMITGYLQRHSDNILILLILGSALSIFVLVLLNSHGPKPRIILHEVEIYGFNVSTSTSTIAATLQITLFCRNNIYHDDVGIHVDKVHVYASYYNQQITPPIPVPPKYLDQSEVAVWSPYFNGTMVPMNRDFAGSLVRDMTAGGVMIDVIVTGRFRSSNGIVMVSGQMEVSCPVYVTFGNKTDDGNVIGSPVKKPLDENCYSKV